MVRPAGGMAPESILVKGQGPAMQETRAFWNCWPSPASIVTATFAAFHLPSGEHGSWPAQGTSPIFGTVNVLAVLPTLTVVELFSEYRTRTSLTVMACAPSGTAVE